MTDNLFVQTDGLRTFSHTHADIAAHLSQLTGAAAPVTAGVETSHGPIASAVSAALGDLLRVRQGTIQTTANSGNTISELLQKAAQLYEQGDQKGAGTLKAAAEVLEGANSANAPGGPAGPSSPTAAGAGVDMMGQMLDQLGQVGQQVGQMTQAAGAPLQALAQPLQQLPQQLMQGVQQANQAGSGLKAPGESASIGGAPDRPQAECAEPLQPRPQSD
jgi:Excreted virulence factor EspC, type VII ESX diderm